MTAPAATWEVPTRVIAGAGALAQLRPLASMHGSRALLISDERLVVSEAVDVVRRQCGLAGVRCATFDGVRPDPDIAVVRAAADAAREARANVILSLGGGSVMDVAKATALGLRVPELLTDDGIEWRGGVGRIRTHPQRSPLATIILPTTFGTGSEVNAVCCLARDGERRRRLLIDLALRPTTALLDPRLTRGLSATARLEAVMEIFLRLLVPYLTDPVERPVQDAITLALLRATIEQGRLAAEPEAGGPDGDGARLALAQLAAASHVAWANIGRPVGGHVLWYLANPVAPLAAVPKMTAVTAITSAYLEAVACELDRALGSAARLARVAAEVFGLDEEPRAAAAAVKALLCEWRLPRGLDDVGMGDVDPPLLTRAAYELWGAPELLGRITPTSCDAIYQAAQCRWSICEEQEGQTCTT